MPLSRTLLLGFLLSLTCLLGRAQACVPEVILIRGGAGYWPGVGAIAEDLAEHGFASRTIMGSLYALEAGKIVSEYHSGLRCSPITVVGYSSGADYACLLCRKLESHGIPVATLLLIEPTVGIPVPANVQSCVNIYKSKPATDWIPAFRGVPVIALGAETELVNIDVNCNDQLQWMASYNHFTMASNSEARVMIRNLLLFRQSQFQLLPDAVVPSLTPPPQPLPDIPPAPGDSYSASKISPGPKVVTVPIKLPDFESSHGFSAPPTPSSTAKVTSEGPAPTVAARLPLITPSMVVAPVTTSHPTVSIQPRTAAPQSRVTLRNVGIESKSRR